MNDLEWSRRFGPHPAPERVAEAYRTLGCQIVDSADVDAELLLTLASDFDWTAIVIASDDGERPDVVLRTGHSEARRSQALQSAMYGLTMPEEFDWYLKQVLVFKVSKEDHDEL